MQIGVVLGECKILQLAAACEHPCSQFLHPCTKRNIHQFFVITKGSGVNHFYTVPYLNGPQVITFCERTISDIFHVSLDGHFDQIIISCECFFTDRLNINRNRHDFCRACVFQQFTSFHLKIRCRRYCFYI